jgi:hypothetical protein
MAAIGNEGVQDHDHDSEGAITRRPRAPRRDEPSVGGHRLTRQLKFSLTCNEFNPARLVPNQQRRGTPVKILTALSRFVHRPQPPAPVAPAPFDDGLVQLAQLIAVDDPATRPDPADAAPAHRVRVRAGL